jgi:predicted nucleic acid-binding Zn ribbon protein
MMNNHFDVQAFFYQCEDCCLVFAVEQSFQEQDVIMCPVCHTDAHMDLVGEGSMTIYVKE